MGDPAGIGLDIAITAWLERRNHAIPAFALLADPVAVHDRAQHLNLGVPIHLVGQCAEASAAFADALPVLPIALSALAVPGKPDPTNSNAVISAIERAVTAVKDGDASAIVTNPISKATLYAAGFSYPGHTEFLSALAGGGDNGRNYSPVMMLTSEDLRVVPLTVHVPLSHVPGLITQARIVETVHVTARALAQDFAIPAPRLAILGLNPHAGENGSIGQEDVTVIAPAVAELRSEGYRVSGPHPADTMFHAEVRKTYDAVIAMYHDQALIPIKTLAFDTAVNVTLGLPFIRTSPDHGTAFDIAGTGRASARSLIESLKLAQTLASRRQATAI